MDAAALVAQLRALSTAGGSYDEQARCCADLRDVAPLPTGAATEDAVRTVVAALARGVQHAMLQWAGCDALGALVHAAPALSATTAAACLTAVLAALRAHLEDADTQCAGCATLAAVVRLDATTRATAGAAGSLGVVVAAMTRHAADLNVVAQGCYALGELAQDDARNAAAALDAGGATAIVAAMRAFPAAVPVQLAGCFALATVVDVLGILGDERAEFAAIDAVVAAMRVQADESVVQKKGCEVLMRTFCDDKNASAAWVRRGAAALTVVTAALRAHRQDLDVLSNGCLAITRLLLSTEDNKRAANAGAVIEDVLSALRAHPAAATLQQYGVNALSNMCRHVRANQLAGAAAGVLEVTISAMRTHATDAGMQGAGCYALGAFVKDVPSSQTRAGKLGCVKLMVAAQRVCAAGPPNVSRTAISVHWCEALMLMVMRHPTNTHAAVAAGAIEACLTHLCTFDDVPDVFRWVCGVLTCLVVGTGHEARAVLAGALEALEARRAEDAAAETARLQLIRRLQPAAQRHDAAPCAVAGCQRCAAARNRGVMCALPSCGARSRDGGAKKLLRCGTCRAACYCSAAHQREDWARHKGECGAPATHDMQAAAASGS
jgi:hypothetical protein